MCYLFQKHQKRFGLGLQRGALRIGENHSPLTPCLCVEGDACLRRGHHIGLDEREQLREFFAALSCGHLSAGTAQRHLFAVDDRRRGVIVRHYRARQPVQKVFNMPRIAEIVFVIFLMRVYVF